jgi:hypothetical protein
MDGDFQNDEMNLVLDLKLDQFPKYHLYHLFKMPTLNGRTITYDELIQYSTQMDGGLKWQYYDPDSRAKAAIVKLIQTYDNKMISEQAFANWLINYLQALPLAKLRNSGN